MENVALAFLDGNEIRELSRLKAGQDDVQFITIKDADGERIYQRGLVFLFYIALKELMPEIKFRVIHSLSHGIYVEADPPEAIHENDLVLIERRMHELVRQAIPFTKKEMTIPEAKAIYAAEGLLYKNEIIDYKRMKKVTMYQCRDYHHYFYGYMVPDTSFIKDFEIVYYAPGFILRHPTPAHPSSVPPFVEQAKTHAIHMEAEHWGRLMEVETVRDLNTKIRQGQDRELIQVQEALHEKKIAQIADDILRQKKRIILISGPSSSGKTTFAQRLKIQLMTSGVTPASISLDNYFVDRVDTPLDEHGEYDFETIEALDLTLLNRHLRDLLQEKPVHLPVFDFISGTKSFSAEPFQLGPEQPLILEGIHALNERLSSGVFQKDKYKIYVSALTVLNLDEHNRIPTTDNRLLRRIVRDHRTRGYSAADTIARFASVRKGEDRHIFPFQENADAIFNSALDYELAVLKKHALPLLEEITLESPVFYHAKRLKKFLYYFLEIEDETMVPSTSILKEFIGGSSLDV
ncbi:MAG TPA: Flp pilus assembly complex ATPase component TadA [Tissierellia bacterium]|nr:Flp pilus assembly complex ATPase component TadA [Tissierellia bacterium]